MNVWQRYLLKFQVPPIDDRDGSRVAEVLKIMEIKPVVEILGVANIRIPYCDDKDVIVSQTVLGENSLVVVTESRSDTREHDAPCRKWGSTHFTKHLGADVVQGLAQVL